MLQTIIMQFSFTWLSHNEYGTSNGTLTLVGKQFWCTLSLHGSLPIQQKIFATSQRVDLNTEYGLPNQTINKEHMWTTYRGWAYPHVIRWCCCIVTSESGRRGNVWNLQTFLDFFLIRVSLTICHCSLWVRKAYQREYMKINKNKDTLLFVRLGDEYTVLYYRWISKCITL